MSVTVVIDSAAGLDREIAASYGIEIVPMRVIVGGTSYEDGTLTISELVARFGEGVSTASAPPGVFAQVFGRIGGEVLALTISGALSSVHDAALMGAAGMESRVRVLDSGTVAGGEALVALHAAKVAAGGGTLDQVESAALQAAERIRLVAAFETAEYIARGGRLMEGAGRMARHLGVRPMIELPWRGKVRLLRPAFSATAAAARMISMWHQTRSEGSSLHVVAMHVDALSAAESLLHRVAAEVRPATALLGRFGAVIAAHVGPGATGLSWWWEG